MFIRAVKKQRSKSSKIFYQYSLVQASRVEGKVKQRVILYLGSDIELKDKKNRDMVLSLLKSKIFRQPELFPNKIPSDLKKLALSYYEKYLIRYGEQATGAVALPPLPEKAEYRQVDVQGVRVTDVRTFGAEHLCRQVLDKLNLKTCLLSLAMSHEQADKALMAIAARAIFSSSEYKTAQVLNMNSELAACYGINTPINHKQLYHLSDQLYSYKDEIDKFLYARITDIFNLNDKIVIFDISNTYFETSKRGSKLAKHGRSKEKRNDCPIVVFTGVVNAYGFMRHSRIYEGNKADPATLEGMITNLEKHSTTDEKKTVVIDAGIATEDNLTLLRKKGYDYVCVSRNRIKDYPFNEDGVITKKTTGGKQEVTLSIFSPEDQPDTWMYVQSDMKRNKQQSMNEKLTARFEEDLQTIKAALDKKGSTKKVEKVWERIGRVRQKNSRVSGRYLISIKQDKGKATDMTWKLKPNPVKEDKEKGIYFIRTSYKKPTEDKLWDIYNTIREVESTFRCLKSDLQLRPVYHQNDERVESHLYLTILAYQLVNTIRHMLKQKGINYDWNNIRRIMSTQTIQTIELPTDKKDIHIRKPAKPIREAKQIYEATGCTDTQKANRKYVVYH